MMSTARKIPGKKLPGIFVRAIYSKSADQAYPATAGRHCRSGARQSTPSISIDNCVEVSISVPPGSTFDGHRNTQAKAGAIPVHDFDEVGLPAPEHEEMAREGVLLRLALDQYREHLCLCAYR
jgi:hypothetical protein